MRMRIDRSIVYPGISDAGIQRTSLDSLLGVGCENALRVFVLSGLGHRKLTFRTWSQYLAR
jgi:hypothetical protein